MNNKTALITGSALRIGRFIALSLAKQGWNLALHYNNSEQNAILLVQELIEYSDVIIYKANLSNAENVNDLFSSIKRDFGSLSLIINNASIHEKGELKDIDLKTIKRDFNLHSFSPLMLAQQMSYHNLSGDIINILDCDIFKNDARYLSYNLSKMSLFEITKKLAVAMAPSVRVNAIALGPILFKEGQKKEVFKKLEDHSPLKEPILLDDLLQTINFLVNVKVITGQCIFLDKGKHLI